MGIGIYFGYVKIDNSNTHYHCFTRIPVEQVNLPVLVVFQFHRSAHCRLDSAGVKKRKKDLALGQDDAFYGEGHLSLTLPVQLTVNSSSCLHSGEPPDLSKFKTAPLWSIMKIYFNDHCHASSVNLNLHSYHSSPQHRCEWRLHQSSTFSRINFICHHVGRPLPPYPLLRNTLKSILCLPEEVKTVKKGKETVAKLLNTSKPLPM